MWFNEPNYTEYNINDKWSSFGYLGSIQLSKKRMWHMAGILVNMVNKLVSQTFFMAHAKPTH